MNRSARQPAISQSTFLPPGEMIVLGVLATLVVTTFRSEFHRSLVVLRLETLAYMVIPLVAMGFIMRSGQETTQILACRKWSKRLQTAALAFAFLPMVSQIFLRQHGIGDSIEIVTLVMILNACWFLVIFSRFGNLDRGAFVTGSALVLFVSFMTQNWTIGIFAFMFGLVSLWWLLGNYWSRVQVKAIDVESNSLPMRGATVLGTVVVIAGIGLLAASLGPIRQSLAMKGFMPSSGGDSWADSYARSGIGDGAMLTAGKNATTSGPVESDDFIEDDKTSMYDIMSDKYEGPIKKKKRQNRAVAITAKAKHMHSVVQSEQKGKSFRTLRHPKEPKDLELENKITDALIFVEGQVPVRITMDCFYHFDGLDWTKHEHSPIPPQNGPIAIESHLGKPWYVIKNPKRKFLTNYRTHQVKIMRLEDEVIPAPPLFKSWHIHRVQHENLFEWDTQGLVRMQGEFIPPHTLIDVVSQAPNYHLLRSSNKFARNAKSSSWWNRIDPWLGVKTNSKVNANVFPPMATDANSPLIQIPENSTKQRLLSVANGMIGDAPEGWQQVEAIINRLRGDFILDPTAVPPTDCENPVAWFLDNGRGPAYLFATTATQLLRTAGYRTRLASGFLATKKDYDRVANQSAITAKNFHMWPELTLDGWHWLPVEPTPGYPLPFNTQTLSQRIYAALCWFGNFILKRPLLPIAFCALSFFIAYFWRQWLATAGWFAWCISLTVLPRQRLKRTRQLLDLRFWAAKFSRPDFVPPSDWYSQVDSDIAGKFIRLWQLNHFSSAKDTPLVGVETYQACCDVVREFSINRIKNVATLKPNES
jgi:hypothetical protein